MKVRDIMTRNVETVRPEDSLKTVARIMRDYEIGFVPVCDGDHVLGVVSDRDLTIRALADGVDSSSGIGQDLMTSPVVHCYDDQEINEAAQLMRDYQIRRLIVLDRTKHLVGIVSLGDVAMNGSRVLSGEVLQSVSEPLVVKQ